jgi:hypothetical protein
MDPAQRDPTTFSGDFGMKRIAVALLIGAGACGVFRRDQDNPTAQSFRLCVQNGTVGYGNITAHADLVRFDVMPGRQVCRLVPAAGPSILLQASTSGGGTAGPLTYANRLTTGAGGCWLWRLTDSPASAVDLIPCANPGADGDTRTP